MTTKTQNAARTGGASQGSGGDAIEMLPQVYHSDEAVSSPEKADEYLDMMRQSIGQPEPFLHWFTLFLGEILEDSADV